LLPQQDPRIPAPNNRPDNKITTLNVIPLATKERLKKIILKSRNPRKSLDLLRSRFANLFL
jgi:hypothetical protein